jgi:putative Holliday junction resolvase
VADDRPRKAPKGAVLGLDLGQSRIGLALSDPDRRVAVALGTIRTGAPEDVKAIAALVNEHDVRDIVVGHPLSLSGESGEAAEHAERFAEALRGFLGLTVTLHDERLSTVEADRGLSGAGLDRRQRRDVIDQAAAVVILQSYLDGLRSGS